eukprot:COSAG01_NODE_14911_length_1396_cov_1.590594_1_plen_74_part_00
MPAAAVESGPKTARRDSLIQIEREAQALWEETKPYEQDFPDDGTNDKWFQTFPYPYMNGRCAHVRAGLWARDR